MNDASLTERHNKLFNFNVGHKLKWYQAQAIDFGYKMGKESLWRYFWHAFEDEGGGKWWFNPYVR